MSYGVSSALQSAVFQALEGSGVLSSLVAGAIYDALPTGPLPPLYVSLGPETATEAGDGSGDGAWHSFVVSVVTDNAGFQSAKQAAGAVSDTLHGADLALERGRLVGLWFHKARAARQSGGVRRIDLTFRARVEDFGGA